MSIFFEEEGSLTLSIEYKRIAEEVTEAVLDSEACPYECQIELLLTMNDEIQEMNNEFRQIDKPTDVLSFPMIGFESPADYEILESDESLFDPESGELMLGNIVISKERMVAQAEEYGHSIEREYAFLIAHSMLHLLGYDHMEEEERHTMEEKQKAVLEGLGITR